MHHGPPKVMQEHSSPPEPEKPPVLTIPMDFETAWQYRYVNKMPAPFRRCDWQDLTVEVYL